MHTAPMTHSDLKSVIPPLKALLDRTEAQPTLAAISKGAKALEATKDREWYLRQPFDGKVPGCDTLTGRPRYVVYLAASLLYDAKGRSRAYHQQTMHGRQMNLIDTVNAFFAHPKELEERLNAGCFDGAQYVGRNDEEGEDSPREIIRRMLDDSHKQGSLFTLIRNGHLGVVWTPFLSDALEHDLLAHAAGCRG